MKYTYKIEQDEYYESPREWDNLTTIYHWHRRYDIGDQRMKINSIQGAYEWMLMDIDGDAMMTIEEDDYNRYQITEYNERMTRSAREKWDTINQRKRHDAIAQALTDRALVLPLYLYDHSGLTISLGAFSCPWDSGQVGFIVVTKESIMSEFNCDDANEWGENGWKTKAQEVARQEIETYDMYLTGDVWGYIIEDENGNIIDSLWGCYGYDYCESEAKAVIKHLQEKDRRNAISEVFDMMRKLTHDLNERKRLHFQSEQWAQAAQV